MKNFIIISGSVCLAFILTLNIFAADKTAPKKKNRLDAPVKIKVVPWGPDQKTLDETKIRVENSTAIQSELNGTDYRLLEFGYLENTDKSQPTQPPTRFRAVFYDYTNDRAISATGDFAGIEPLKVQQEFYQPLPDNEEFAEAVRLIGQDKNFETPVKSKTLTSYRPMPPVTILDGTNERLVNVGLMAADSGETNEIVSVRIKDGKIIRYKKGAPETSSATSESCGITYANQFTTGFGTAGQYQLSVTQNGETLWEMLIIRPSASSGTFKSGVEVNDVKYKGKSVLKRGHVPVLNVQYPNGACGPYRDWQYQEGMFVTDPNSINPAPGIRILPPGKIAQTIIDNGSDVGDFRGVAIYTENNETVLVTEMEAGWYRYVMKWRFANDGTIRPRFGFEAVRDGCVCNIHNHHAYWRFDFDIVNPANKVFQTERGRKFLQPITTETTMLKRIQTNRSLLIQNSTGNEAYLLVPNLTDGTADTFARSDFWVLRYKNVIGGTSLQNEIDDGYNSFDGECTENNGSCININKFINGESVSDKDVVVWYGAHFIHDDAGSTANQTGKSSDHAEAHIVGPDIRPVRW